MGSNLVGSWVNFNLCFHDSVSTLFRKTIYDIYKKRRYFILLTIRESKTHLRTQSKVYVLNRCYVITPPSHNINPPLKANEVNVAL